MRGWVLLLLALASVSLHTIEAKKKDVGEHGKRDSNYYKWQRDKDGVQEKAADAKEKQAAAREATSEARTDEEKQILKLVKIMERKSQYKSEAVAVEKFEEAARLHSEIEELKIELEELETASKCTSGDEQCTAKHKEDEEYEEDAEDENEDEAEIEVRSPLPQCPDGYWDHDKDPRSPCEPYGDLNLQRVEQQIDGLEWFIATSSVEADKTAAKDMQEKIRDLVKWAVESKFVYTDLREAQKEGLDTKNIHANLNDADQAKYEANQKTVGTKIVKILEQIDALSLGELKESAAYSKYDRESEFYRQRNELAGALTVTFVNWLNVNRNTTIQNAIVPEFKPPIMTDEERAVAQKKNGKLKASSAGQLFGWMCPGCPWTRGSDNSRGRWVLAIGKDVEERIPTLYVAKNQRATIDGHGHRWAKNVMIANQWNERRFVVNEGGRLKLLRLQLVGAALSTVGHGASIFVQNKGLLEVSECEFRANMARSQGGAICVEGTATIMKSAFYGNYAYGSGGAINAGFNAPGQPPTPPSLSVVECTFKDNVAKMKNGANAIMFGKSTKKVGTIVDNQGDVLYSIQS